MYRIDSNGVYIYSATVMPSLCRFYSKDNDSRIIDLLLIVYTSIFVLLNQWHALYVINYM